MDRFETLRVFLAVAEAGSFIGASRKLGLSAPAVTRAVARLEDHLGAPLFHRTTRAVRLSEAGARYRNDASLVLERLAEADDAVRGEYGEPQGLLKVTAPVLFGQRFVLPVVAAFLESNPKVEVQALFLDRVVNLLEDDLDVAVRLGHLEDSGLFFKTVGAIRKVTCAAPSYLDRFGRPAAPSDLKDHQAILATGVESSPVWTFGGQRVRTRPRLRCNQNGAAVSAAVSGLGIARVMSYQVADEVASGALELILESFEPTPVPVNLIYLDGRQASASVRSFIDFAAGQLGTNAFLNS